MELNICGFVGGGEGESELCINSWFCVLLTHFYLLSIVYIYIQNGLLAGGEAYWCGEMASFE